MSSKPSRRDFLVTASLAGAALAAGAAAGCGGKTEESESTRGPASSGGAPDSNAHKPAALADVAPGKEQVIVDEEGRLVVKDRKIADYLSTVIRTQNERAQKAGNSFTEGICVVFDAVPAESSTVGSYTPKGNSKQMTTPGLQRTGTITGPAGKPINSLCACQPAQ